MAALGEKNCGAYAPGRPRAAVPTRASLFPHTGFAGEGAGLHNVKGKGRGRGRPRYTLLVLSEDADDASLDLDGVGGDDDGGHGGVGGLETDFVSFFIEALEGGVGAID
jgi:hypothetical protein